MSESGKPADENADVRRELVAPSADGNEAKDNDRSPTKTDRDLMPVGDAEAPEATADDGEVIRRLVIPDQVSEGNDGDRSPTKTDRDLKIE